MHWFLKWKFTEEYQQYKHQIEYPHERNEGLVTANKRLREDLEELNSHYQELISVSKEALKTKR